MMNVRDGWIGIGSSDPKSGTRAPEILIACWVFDIGNWNRLEDIEKMPLESWEY